MTTIDRLPQPRAAGEPTALARRLDALDTLIWKAAHTLDDAQLAVKQARVFAAEIFTALVLAAGSGVHRLNCSVPTGSGPLTAAENVPLVIAEDLRAVGLPEDRGEQELCELIALARLTGVEATVIMRSRPLEDSAAPASAGYTVRGWRLADGGSAPIDAAGMFAFCCSEASSGEPLPLDPGTRYADARPLLTTPRPG